jgi:O-antigen/teichoic acid export membrane protein
MNIGSGARMTSSPLPGKSAPISQSNGQGASVELRPEPEAAAEASLGARATAGAAWIFVENGFVQGLAFVVFAVIARYVTAADVGLISITFIITQGTRMLLFEGIVMAVIRKSSPTAIEFTTGFWMMLANATAATALIVAAAPALQTVFAAPGLQSVIKAMSLTVMMYGVSSMQETWLLRHFRFKALALRAIVASLAGACVGIALALKNFGVMALVSQQLVMMAVNAALLWVACPWKPSLRFSRPVAREIATFAFGLFPSRLIGMANQNCDTILVGILFGPASVGIYNVAKRARLALQLVAWGPINGVVLPTFAELQAEPERFRKGVLASLAIVSALCAPLFFGTAAIAHDAVLVVFGPRWIAAAPVLAILAFGGFAAVLGTVNDTIFMTLGRPTICSLAAVLYVVLAVPLFLYFREWPSLPFALPFVLPYCLLLPAYIWLCRRFAEIPVLAWMRSVSPSVLAGVVMFCVVRLLVAVLPALPLAVRLLITCGSGATIYVAVMYVLDRPAWLMMYDFVSRFTRKFRRTPSIQVGVSSL